MLNRLGLNSSNSSKPPSTDKKKGKKNNRPKSNKKPGGQPGRLGKQLKLVSDPDIIEDIKIDKRTLPRGNYKESGFEARQVIDIDVSVTVTEYRAQVLMDEAGNRFVATFPGHVKRPIQYGSSVKSQSVYMSQYQFIPYGRIHDYFINQAKFTISQGSLYNFNLEAYKALDLFEKACKTQLAQSARANADETGINIKGEKYWLHTTCNDLWTHFFPHKRRGKEAMDDIGILPQFNGVLCHDHWKSYYRYGCKHSLCNAHHLRELTWSFEEDRQKWAEKMKKLLLKINEKVEKAGGKLTIKQQRYYLKKYDAILVGGEIECPPPEALKKTKANEKPKKSKSRRLLERLIKYKEDVLRFMTREDIPSLRAMESGTRGRVVPCRRRCLG